MSTMNPFKMKPEKIEGSFRDWKELYGKAYDKYTTDKKDPNDEIPDGSYSVDEVLGEKNYPESRRSARAEGERPPIVPEGQSSHKETT